MLVDQGPCCIFFTFACLALHNTTLCFLPLILLNLALLVIIQSLTNEVLDMT